MAFLMILNTYVSQKVTCKVGLYPVRVLWATGSFYKVPEQGMDWKFRPRLINGRIWKKQPMPPVNILKLHMLNSATGLLQLLRTTVEWVALVLKLHFSEQIIITTCSYLKRLI